MKSISIAIIGLGPRGLNVLERLCALMHGQEPSKHIELLLIDPSIPGQGVHENCQPDHLLVNTVAGQITMYSDDTVEEAGPVLPGPSFLNWARDSGYRNVEGKYIITTAGIEIGENDYLPRYLLGEYLAAVYDDLIARLSPVISITNYRKHATDIFHRNDEKFVISLEGGYKVSADFCVLAMGHCASEYDTFDLMFDAYARRGQPHNSRLQYFNSPYPVASLKTIGNDSSVAVCGVGLTASDVLSALTTGVGGTYEKAEPGRYRYIPSGREPSITIFSRQGIPFSGRAINQKGISHQYKARFFTRAFIDSMRLDAGENNKPRQLDFDRDLWPCLLKEMTYAYECTMKKRWPDPAAFAPQASSVAAIAEIISPLSGQQFASYDDYECYVVDYLKRDIADSYQGNIQNPRKAATDVIRDLRDNLRYAVDHCGLTPESHERFLSHWCSIMNRIAVGPPKERNMELLALIEAGIVKFGLGQNPSMSFDETRNQFSVSSTSLAEPVTRHFDVIIRAKIDTFEPEKSRSLLVRNLLKSGLAAPFKNGDFKPSGLAIDKSSKLLRADGHPTRNLWALGNIVEGANFYTFVLPRPGVNSRSIQDAGKVAMSILDQIDPRFCTNATWRKQSKAA